MSDRSASSADSPLRRSFHDADWDANSSLKERRHSLMGGKKVKVYEIDVGKYEENISDGPRCIISFLMILE